MHRIAKSIAVGLTASSIAWLGSTALVATTSIPSTTRQVVLAKDADGRYGWSLVQVAVPTVGDHQVLLHVHAVALQHGELELLDSLNKATDKARDRTGQIVCSDAAGEVVAVGKHVTSVRTGTRVTSLYFADYLDGPLTPAKQAQGHRRALRSLMTGSGGMWRRGRADFSDQKRTDAVGSEKLAIARSKPRSPAGGRQFGVREARGMMQMVALLHSGVRAVRDSVRMWKEVVFDSTACARDS